MRQTISTLASLLMAIGLPLGCAKQDTAPVSSAATASDNTDSEAPDPTDVTNGGPSQSRGGGPGRFGGAGEFDPAAIFARRDENQDGKLTGDELSGRMQDRLEQLDKDGDGAISREEFEEGMQSVFTGGGDRQDGSGGGRGRGDGIGGRGRGFDPSAIFDRRDENRDGKLTGDELSGRMQDRVDQLDTDGDGAISRKEFEAGMQNMFGGRGGRGGIGGGRGGPGDRPSRPARPEVDEEEDASQ